MKRLLSLGILLITFLFIMDTVAQTSGDHWSDHKIDKWYKKLEWLGGLQLKPHETINKREFARQYELNKKYWDEAFAFLKGQDLQTLAIGKHVIDSDNVYGLVTQNPTKDYDSTQWESHRNYVDLQYVIRGEERIGVSPLRNLTVTKPYDASKDLINYLGKGKMYKGVPGIFFLFFPSDAHKPNITTGDKKADKKIVIKIKYSE